MSDAPSRTRAASLSPLDREDRYIKRNERSIASLVSLLVHLLFVLALLYSSKLELAQTVKVCLFANNSLEPRAATLVTGALADELQRDGTYRLSSGADADIRVEGEVYSITFDQLRSSREDTYKSTELGLRLSVKYRVVDARTQEILYAGSAEEVGQFFDQGNIQSARTNALSYAARLVATSIAETLTNG